MMISVISGLYKYYGFIQQEHSIDSFTVSILQLSGARGILGFIGTPNEIIRLLTLMLPELCLIFLLGRSLYASFCTGSVYVLSRFYKRKAWFLKEISKIALSTFFYFLISTLTICGMTVGIKHMVPDKTGIIVMLLHIFIYSLWFFSLVMIFAVAAIKRGSSESMLYTLLYYGGLLVSFSFFAGKPEKNVFLEINPISRTFLNWYDIPGIMEKIVNRHYIVRMDYSCIYMVIYTAVVVIICETLICRNDLIINDKEVGTM
jgi:hypothetical protein